MFRIKNEFEEIESRPGECVIAKCHNFAAHEYDNIYNKVPVCDIHFKQLKALAYGD